MVKDHQIRAIKGVARQQRLEAPMSTHTRVIQDERREEEEDNHDTQFWLNTMEEDNVEHE